MAIILIVVEHNLCVPTWEFVACESTFPLCVIGTGVAVTEFWQASVDQTVKSSEEFVRARNCRKKDVADWFAQYAETGPTSSNQGSANLPFQRWFHFKEAFSPKFVADTLTSLPYRVDCCLDAFGGSGTTALTCRMLGASSISFDDRVRWRSTRLGCSGFSWAACLSITAM